MRSGAALGLLFCLGTASAEAELATIQLRHRLPQEIAGLVAPLLEPGETVVPASNSLIVKASLPRLQELSTLVQELDQKQHRLRITVVQGRGLTREALNARADIGVNIDNQGNASVGGRGHVYQTESVEAGGQSQQVQTLDGQSAVIRFGQQIALPQGGVAYGYGGGAAIYGPGVDYRDVTAGFSVVPRLTGDGVILQISPWSDRVNRGGFGSISTQSADTTVNIGLGEWVEIGGQGENINRQQGGLIAHNYSTRSETNRIFIKVDDLDAAR